VGGGSLNLPSQRDVDRTLGRIGLATLSQLRAQGPRGFRTANDSFLTQKDVTAPSIQPDAATRFMAEVAAGATGAA